MLTCVRHIEETTSMKRIIRAVVMALLLVPGILWANDLTQQFSAGVDAYKAGEYETAYEIWLPMAENGHAYAQTLLGSLYQNGEGVVQDYVEAARWYRLAAEQGIAGAQSNLGIMYHQGQGVLQDYAEAARWYRLAAEQGVAEAQFNLGFGYYQGIGVIQDYEEAVRWYRLAAEQGNARAQLNLGLMYTLGNGVIQDYSTAHMWFNIAARNGDSDAVNMRDAIAEELPPEAIAAAQSRARICIESDSQDCD